MQMKQGQVKPKYLAAVSGKGRQHSRRDNTEQKVVTEDVMVGNVILLAHHNSQSIHVSDRCSDHAKQSFYGRQAEQISHTPPRHHMRLNVHRTGLGNSSAEVRGTE